MTRVAHRSPTTIHFDPQSARESSSLAHIEFPHEQNDMRYRDRDRVRSIQGYYYTWPSIIIIITTVEHEYWGVWPSKQMRRAEREYSAVWKSFCVQGSPCSSTTTTTDETERTHKIKVIKMLNLFSSSHTHTPGNNLNKCKSRDMNKPLSICCLCLVDTWVDCDDPVDDRYDENDTNDGHP